jgi:tetratricopeptide (TPR) repeat protein
VTSSKANDRLGARACSRFILPALAAMMLSGCGNTEPIEERSPPPGRLLNAAGLELLLGGKLEAAEGHFLRAAGEAEAIDDLQGKAEAIYNLGLTHRDQGRLQEAFQELVSSESLFRRLGDRVGTVRSLAAQASVHLLAGRLEEAREACERARGEAPESVAAEVLVNHSILLSKLGEAKEARSAAREAVSRAADERVRADALHRLARLDIEAGDDAAAHAALLEAAEIDRQAGRLRHLGQTLLLLGRLSARQGDFRQASEYFARAAGIYEGLGLAPEAEAARRGSSLPRTGDLEGAARKAASGGESPAAAPAGGNGAGR